MLRDRDFKRAAAALRPHLSGLVLLVSIGVSLGMGFAVDGAAAGEPFFNWAHYAREIVVFGALFSVILLAFCAGPFVGYVRSRNGPWMPRRDRTLRLAWGSPFGLVAVLGWCVLRAIAVAAEPSFSFTNGTNANLHGALGQLVQVLGEPWTAPLAWLTGSWLMGLLVNPDVVRRWLGISAHGACDACGYPVADGATCSECGQIKLIPQRPEDRRPW